MRPATSITPLFLPLVILPHLARNRTQLRADTPEAADYEKHLNRIDDGHGKSFCAATESAMQPPNWNLACQASVRQSAYAASARRMSLT